jgi:hypothetical protein
MKKIVDGKLLDMTPAEVAELEAMRQAASSTPFPITVTKVQALVALHRVGKLDAVKTVVAQDPENQIWFDNAPTWERNNPRIIQLAPYAGLTAKDLDDLFALAATITE